MSTSLNAFRSGLYEEHLEEISFLYTQTRFLREGEQPWQRAVNFEHRLEMHLDALVVGGTFALNVCRRRALDGDAGELFGAVSLYCRQEQPALMAAVLKQIDPADEAQMTAVATALKYEMPQSWVTFVEQALTRGDHRLVPLLASACGYRRIDCGAALLAALKRSEQPPIELVQALGRLHKRDAEADLKALLARDLPALQSEVLLALLQLGDGSALNAHYLVAQQHDWPHLALALGGDAGACNVLMPNPASGRVSRSSLLALGLLGVPSTLRHLYECLAIPPLAEPAAQAMNWITGADLYEEAYVPAAVDEDELFPKELKAWRQYKEAPKAADGRPFGSGQRKLSTAPADWKQWFAANLQRFDAQLRYRRGIPLGPQQLVSDLAAPTTDNLLRHWSALELAIRYRYEQPFETDMPVAAQVRAIQAMNRWLAADARAFVPGAWYFDGRLMKQEPS
ncbi:MAG: hypothetical protein H7Z15_14770 [Rhizobacter sp.]|nr:hypothetical protein [Rhizobacter sp.]